MQITPEQINYLEAAVRMLDLASRTLDRQRLAGTDQNPLGFRDLLFSGLSDVRTVAEALKRGNELKLPNRRDLNLAIQAAEKGAATMRKALDSAERQVRDLSAENARLRAERARMNATLKSVNLDRK